MIETGSNAAPIVRTDVCIIGSGHGAAAREGDQPGEADDACDPAWVSAYVGLLLHNPCPRSVTQPRPRAARAHRRGRSTR